MQDHQQKQGQNGGACERQVHPAEYCFRVVGKIHFAKADDKAIHHISEVSKAIHIGAQGQAQYMRELLCCVFLINELNAQHDEERGKEILLMSESTFKFFLKGLAGGSSFAYRERER
jgi:hypothetical protein